MAGACRLSPWCDGEWIRPHALEPHDPVRPAPFDGPLPLQHESELDEELSRGCEVVNHDADVVHPLDRHAFDGKEQRFAWKLW